MKEIFAEVITIGDEILYGQIVDTNSAWISSELDKLGFTIKRKYSIGDNREEISSSLKESLTRSDLIILTGGLGPTNDDVTKEVLSNFFSSKLIINEQVLKGLEDFFTKRGKELSERNKGQALLPDKCIPLYNRWGTAPGMLFNENGKIIVSMPGVPFEMKNIFLEELIPILKLKFKTNYIIHKIVKTTGIAESYLADMIKYWENCLPDHIKLAYLPSPGLVKLRLTGKGENKLQIVDGINNEIQGLKKLISKYIYGYDEDNAEELLGIALKAKKLTIATAESCTGGYIAHMITSVPGSSEYFIGGIIAYDNSIKIQELGVKEETLRKHGAVSEKTVKKMAEAVRKKLGTDIGISTSGIAGPDGGSTEKPVGTVWLGYSDKDKTIAKKLVLGTDRIYNIKHSGMSALAFILESLK